MKLTRAIVSLPELGLRASSVSSSGFPRLQNLKLYTLHSFGFKVYIGLRSVQALWGSSTAGV